MKSMKDHYIVCGYGRMGIEIVEGLEAQGHKFIVIDNDASKVDFFQNHNILYIIGDATSEEVLKECRG